MKIKCTKCKVEKEANDKNFGKDRRTSNGFNSQCKECVHERMKKYIPKVKNGWQNMWIGGKTI